MGKRKSRDVDELYSIIWQQLKEDREKLVEIHQELRSFCKNNPERYVVSGADLAKFSELLVKQTSQAVEVMKVLQKEDEKDDSLTPEDMENIAKAIQQNKK